MSRVNRAGATALLVVDMQVGALENAWQRDRVIDAVVDLVNRARLAGTPVVWVQDSGVVGDGWQLVEQLAPDPGESRIEKQWGDSFAETELDQVLGAAGVSRVLLCGARSDHCIQATVAGGLYRGYDVALIGDAHTTDASSFEGVTLPAETLVAVINKLAWTTSLPQVRATVLASSEVDFEPAISDDALLRQAEADNQADEDDAVLSRG